MPNELPRSAARAARVIRFRPGITRADLARALGVGVTSVNPIVSRLIERGEICERPLPRAAGSLGRPRAGLAAQGPRETLAAVIWSHGNLDEVLVTYDGEIAWRRREVPDVRPRDAEIVGAAEALFAAAAPMTHLAPPSALVLALPAPYEAGVGLAGGVAGAEGAERGYTRWFARDPFQTLSPRFEVPVVVENDANLGALGEATARDARPGSLMIYIKLSDQGIGAGIVVDRRLLRGSHGFAGEIAHVQVDQESPVICACGSRGCLDGLLGPELLRPLAATYGADITYRRLLDLAADGAPGPVRVLLDAGRTVGRAVADMATYLNPDEIILDAGSAEGSRIVLRGVSEQIERSAPPFICRGLALRTSALLDDAPVLGAVELAREVCLR